MNETIREYMRAGLGAIMLGLPIITAAIVHGPVDRARLPNRPEVRTQYVRREDLNNDGIEDLVVTSDIRVRSGCCRYEVQQLRTALIGQRNGEYLTLEQYRSQAQDANELRTIEDRLRR